MFATMLLTAAVATGQPPADVQQFHQDLGTFCRAARVVSKLTDELAEPKVMDAALKKVDDAFDKLDERRAPAKLYKDAVVALEKCFCLSEHVAVARESVRGDAQEAIQALDRLQAMRRNLDGIIERIESVAGK